MSNDHILIKEGILKSFSIFKKISVQSLKKKKSNKTENDEEVPGFEEPFSNATNEEKEMLTKFSYFSSLIAKKMVKEKIDKYHACYVINSIISMLGLDEDDFENFHKKFNKMIGENDDDENNEENTSFEW
jgi:hypothetical protein